MNEKNQKKKKAQELAANRVLAVFVVIVLLLWGMSALYRMMTFGTSFVLGQRICTIVLGVSAAGTAILLWLCASARKKGTFHGEKLLNSAFFALCTGAAAVCSLILKLDYYHGMHILYVLLPAAGVLYLIYHVYDRQFFTFCVAEAAAIAGVYSVYVRAWERYAILFIAAVLAAIPLILALTGKKNAMTRFVLGHQYDRKYTVLSYAVSLAVMAVAAAVGGKIALVLGIAMGVYLLCAAVYYTVRAM